MKKTWQKIIATLLVIVAGLLAIYYLVFTKVALVSDESFSLNMKNFDYMDLRLDLAKKGARLSIVETSSSKLTNSDNLQELIFKLSNSDYVLFSPVMTSVCDTLSVDVSSLLNNTVTVGISNVDRGNFDFILKSQEIELLEGEVDYRKSLSNDNATTIVMPDLKRAFSDILTYSKTDITFDMGTLYYEKRSLK